MSDAQDGLQAWTPQLRSVLRIVTALLFMQHGSAKLFHLPYQAAFAHLHLMSLMGVQGILEFFGGLLLLVGLFSRPIAFLLSGDMAVAFFMVHFKRGWLPILNGGDLAVLFSFVYLYLWFAGPGPWSVDAWLRGSRAVSQRSPQGA
jgi:putative oxidoreductase